MSFLAWRRFVAGTSLQCWPHRPQPAWLWGSGMHKAGSLSPSSLLPVKDPPLPSLGPLRGWGTSCRLALGCPGSPIPPSLCGRPGAEPAGRGRGCTPQSQPRAGSPGANLLKARGYFGGGGERRGEHGVLMPAALLTASLWLPVLAGRCQPAGEGCHHPGRLWVLGRAAKLGLAAVPAHVWLRPGGVTPPRRPKCCHAKLPATD